MPEFENMVCLVGENPLPIWFGIHQFAPKDRPAKVVLAYSAGTKKVAKNIKSQIDAEYGTGLHKITCIFDPCGEISDPFLPSGVRDALAKLEIQYKLKQTKYALNYTGGTKVMSAYSLLHWEKELNINEAFYLEEARAQFNFDNDHIEPLSSSIDLDIHTLRSLHGLKKITERALPDCSRADTEQIFTKRFALRIKLHSYQHLDDMSAEDEHAWFAAQHDGGTGTWKPNCPWLDLLSFLPTSTRTKWEAEPLPSLDDYVKEDSKLAAQFRFFVSNLWFEMWVRFIIAKLLPSGREIHVGLEFFVSGQQFEVDVITIVNHRLCYFSVTTSDNEGICKKKMFEAIQRSQQIGGGLARSCVISLADRNRNWKTGHFEPIIEKCRLSVTGRREGGNHTIFGLPDVKKWIGVHDPCTDLEHFLYRKGVFAK